jgi:hypothetical protein
MSRKTFSSARIALASIVALSATGVAMSTANAAPQLSVCIDRATKVLHLSPTNRCNADGSQILRVIGGDDGAPGATGPRGAQGDQGSDGAAGSNGAAGAQGIQGIQGPQGLQGPAGPVGGTGASGNNGAVGGTGVTGNNGVVGGTGLTGNNGAVGGTGLTGGTGVQGIQGIQGIQGPTGPSGSTGSNGGTGATGNNGGIGGTGADGPMGGTGADGAVGGTGADGGTGPAGPANAQNVAYFFNTGAQTVAIEDDVTFNGYTVDFGFPWGFGSSHIGVGHAGYYKVEFSVSGVEPNQFALTLNGAVVSGSTYESGAGTQLNNGTVTLHLAVDDTLTLRNHSSASAITLSTSLAGTANNVNASLSIEQVRNG